MRRRNFLKSTMLGGLGLTLGTDSLLGAASVLTSKRTPVNTEKGRLIFEPVYVQKGTGPHLFDWAYATDKNWDAFHSNIHVNRSGVVISNTVEVEKFGIDVRWNVEGFGYIFITADNAGEYYELPEKGQTINLNLNYELAKSRVNRNRKRKKNFKPSLEVNRLIGLSEELLEASAKVNDKQKSAGYAQTSLYYAMVAGEKLELEKADYIIHANPYRPEFFVGCDTRAYFQMDPDTFLEKFTEAFNYATITHYLTHSTYHDFEPREGEKQFSLRTALHAELIKRNITVEGRPLFYFYKTVTPDWLRNKSYSQLLKYVENHTKEVVGHYGEGMYAWEIINEAHDWANELQLTPEQIVEVTKLACDVARETNPKVHRLINNCCPFAEYVQLKKWGEIDAKYPQRTPIKFMRDLVDAGVDFTISGQQMYFPYRDLQDIIINLERWEQFGKPLQITEVGVSSGPTKELISSGQWDIPDEPYIWHRHWDQNLQAEWVESLYTLAYSKTWIEAVNWYDFVDPHSWIKGGGLLESPKGEVKQVYKRIIDLQKKWKKL
ncbi:MAG: endo-1,4-beta-xylanase [Melioribacteraceae bacterium]|nr:endo-1,4-beta-xylanase [Melioribacteraceae bacterium]